MYVVLLHFWSAHKLCLFGGIFASRIGCYIFTADLRSIVHARAVSCSIPPRLSCSGHSLSNSPCPSSSFARRESTADFHGKIFQWQEILFRCIVDRSL
ncbi:hypothetical protein EV702DRAFT_1119010 [Suillus placidus]|uniref:Uncharacterized protein n=1 Tax=Suillus placidus TaxID=48579 RepID=A0A9P7D133_9AGAM|nr:hypothetical protein EV702DRAFT_1119010 [Suillus placidus]